MTDQSHSKPIMTNLLARKSLVIFSPIAMPWMRTLNITSISSIDQSLCWSVTKVSWGTSPAAPQGWSAIRPPMRQLWWKEPTKEWFIWKVQYFHRFREISSILHLIIFIRKTIGEKSISWNWFTNGIAFVIMHYDNSVEKYYIMQSRFLLKNQHFFRQMIFCTKEVT